MVKLASRGMQWCGSGLSVPLKLKWVQLGRSMMSKRTNALIITNSFKLHKPHTLSRAYQHLYSSHFCFYEGGLSPTLNYFHDRQKKFHANYIVHSPVFHSKLIFIIIYWKEKKKKHELSFWCLDNECPLFQAKLRDNNIWICCAFISNAHLYQNDENKYQQIDRSINQSNTI